MDEKFAAEWDIPPAEYRDAVLSCLSDLVEGTEIRVRCRDDSLIEFLKSKSWLTAFMTGEKTKHHMELRRTVEYNVLGVPLAAEDHERPAYGYLSGSDENNDRLASYGSVVLHLNRSRRATSTVCCGDSFVMTGEGDDPTTAAAPLHQVDLLCRHAETDAYDASVLVDVVDERHGYAEVQLHEMLLVRHLDFVTFTKNIPPSQELVRLLGSIPFQTIAGVMP